MKAYEDLRLFLHLSRSLRFARTARECHVSPAALSRTIQRLEKELGLALFVRDKRNVELTRAGRTFQQYASDTLERWDRFDRALHDTGTLQGTLSIFSTVTAAQSFLPETLGRFREAYPDVHIRLETGYAADALAMLDARVDVSVPALPDHLPRSVVAHTLAVTPLTFVAPKLPGDVSRAVERRDVRWADVPLVVPPVGVTRDAVDRWFRELGEQPTIYSEVPSHEAILSLVAMGCAVGVVPQLVFERSALRDRLRVVAIRRPLGELHVGACVLRRRLREPLIAAFWETLGAERRPPSETTRQHPR